MSLALGSINDVGIWGPLSDIPWKYFIAAIGLVGCLFVLIVLVFIPLGQVVSREMDSASNALRGYSFNLIGSVIGVVTFFLLGRWMLPPIVWMATILLSLRLCISPVQPPSCNGHSQLGGTCSVASV